MILLLLSIAFALSLVGFVLALRSTPKAGYQTPVRPARSTDPALFKPLEGEKGDFPRGTWVQ